MALTGWNMALLSSAFCVGMMLVHKLQSRKPVGAKLRGGIVSSRPRPGNQIAVVGLERLVSDTKTSALLKSIDSRTKFSRNAFDRDCEPVLRAFAEFVQMLPASECHHHAQPGGLWTHALEVVDAALTFRNGMEIPPGMTTELRKKLEHRWTYAVFAAALLHDVGKPVSDLRVQIFAGDPTAGRRWAPLAGPMGTQGAQFYSVTFADPGERDYKAHQKLAAMLLHRFVPPNVIRWMSEESDVLQQLLAYLANEDPDGILGSIVKRADSDSVRRNLLQGPRTRFSSARTRPLIERLMEALRRMLQEGATLPLNRPGAAGWVFDDCVWFVCARLADEVRTYLSQHESGQGIPGKDKNDRLFDTWQESGACRPAPDGGAVWRVRVECDGWKPPDVFTVLCFPLDKLYEKAAQYPVAMKGRITVDKAAAPVVAASPAPVAAAASPAVLAVPAGIPHPPKATAPAAPAAGPAAVAPPKAVPVVVATKVEPSPKTLTSQLPGAYVSPEPSSALDSDDGDALHKEAPAPVTMLPAPEDSLFAEVLLLVQEGQEVTVELLQTRLHVGYNRAARLIELLQHSGIRSTAAPTRQEVAASPAQPDPFVDESQGVLILSPAESAVLVEPIAAPAPGQLAPATLGPPSRPHTSPDLPKPKRAASPAAEAFMSWVAHTVGTGETKYNEDGALVHFVGEGCLLLSPEIFKRFIDLHATVPDGPVAALRESHGDKAFSRLQNELAKSGWTKRNGDENLHYYAFTKTDGGLSRAASFYLLPNPKLFWNPVPRVNDRIRLAARTKKLAVPGLTKTPS
jgi:integrating conjugative element relaxase (TIGR03760 family)